MGSRNRFQNLQSRPGPLEAEHLSAGESLQQPVQGPSGGRGDTDLGWAPCQDWSSREEEMSGRGLARTQHLRLEKQRKTWMAVEMWVMS